MKSYRNLLFLFVALWLTTSAGAVDLKSIKENISADKACVRMTEKGLRPIAEQQSKRFLGKVTEDTANCRGGDKALAYRDSVWVDWANYWAAGDASSLAEGLEAITELGKHLKPNGRGVDGALMDLEYQRMELIRFNLYDNKTYESYINGDGKTAGPVLKTWEAMRLPASHPQFQQVTSDNGAQLCKGDLIRHRNLTGICNDIYNPAMGSTHQLFARNVRFESTFPQLGENELARNRHADRLGLLKPDPQIISRKLFTRSQEKPEACKLGQGLPGYAKDAQCDYKKAPFFNVLAAYWIQFMTHDWFYHLVEGHNSDEKMPAGCTTQLVNNQEQPVTAEQATKLGCRQKDQVDVALIAQHEPAPTFEYEGKTYLSRAPRTTENNVTAWWDASQIYGFDELSLKRVKRDPNDSAKLLMIPRGKHSGAGEQFGYLPVFNSCENSEADCVADPINPAWKDQEAAAFADNWTVGLSFFHNLFVREHNLFVDAFRAKAAATPQADSGLRNPANLEQVIPYKAVSNEE